MLNHSQTDEGLLLLERKGFLNELARKLIQKVKKAFCWDFQAILQDFEAILQDFEAILQDFEAIPQDFQAILQDFEAILQDFQAIFKDFEFGIHSFRNQKFQVEKIRTMKIPFNNATLSLYVA